MKPAHAIALALIPFLTLAAAVAATWSARVRDTFFVLMVTLAVVAERMDVNFLSEAWYRGTTRGIEVTVVGILAFGLLVGCWIGRRGEERRWFWPGSLGLMLLYLGYATASVLTSEPKLFGAFELSKMVTGLILFLAVAAYARSQREWTLLLFALGGAVAFEGLWAVKQHFITRLDRVSGTLDHANSLSMYFCLTVPPLVAAACAGWTRRLRWFCGITAALGGVGLLLTFSRAGIPVFAVVSVGTFVTCATWQLRASQIVVRSLVAVGAVAVVAAFWGRIEERYAQATLQEEYFDPTVDGRGIYLRLAGEIVEDHFFGVGLNNWSYHVSRTYGQRLGFHFMDYDHLVSIYGTEDPLLFANSYLAAPAHNLGALTLGELGVPGLTLFALLWLRWFGMGAAFLRLPREEPMRVLGVGLLFSIAGIFGQSITEWVYRQTPINFTFFILLGTLASLAAARRDGRMSAPASEAALPVASVAREETLVAERV